jgi:mono/diheme cytochrome c family protein
MVETDKRFEPAEAPASLAGALAEFSSAEALVEAAAAVRHAGYRRWDCHSPYPVHGIDRAMGIRFTPLPWLVFGAGLTGAVVAVLLQWWTNGVDYPLVISGKPLLALPANIAIAFELTILFAGVTAFFGCLGLNRLPRLAHPLLRSPRFRRATTDGMFISIDAADAQFDAAATPRLLESLGATAVELCYEPAAGRAIPRPLLMALVVLAALALLPPLLIARARLVKSTQPRIHIITDMAFQPKYKMQAASPLFADGRAARPPVPGAIADGQLHDDAHWYLGKLPDGRFAATFPLPVTEALMRRGQERFNVYCAVCHGLAGMGDGIIPQRTAAEGKPWLPVSLHEISVRSQPVGQLFNTITNGIRTMPAYASQIPVEDRWVIILYVRALQRSRAATLDDVPAELRDKIR